ncbi:aminomethyl transferase family protein [Streptomyces acidiscabies]|uniref:aminomethyl transferase family protein n=1 Tax=Streptomyces acidiscabies TaxID=42234 RepID=UPI0009633BB4|nr:aminomethyl transferase family protein [Streptomyces acidiscabies]GAV37843.1 aminomethyltransferase [Streptomyces acidiscabies]
MTDQPHLETLQQRIDRSGGPLAMLRTNPATHYPFTYAQEYTTWHNEQWAWKNACVLFDQSHHMTEVHITGPDVKRLISDTGVNSPATLGRDRAKQFVAVGPDGRYIGDCILFGLEEDHLSLVGVPQAANWVQFQAQQGDYDVEFSVDPASVHNPLGRRQHYRYQLNGPRTQEILERAVGAPIDRIPFFRMGSFAIAGTPVRALNHTMAGVPGEEYTGLELFGPVEHGPSVLETLLHAGAQSGLRQGGAVSYLSSTVESGWIPAVPSAVYSSPETAAYRQHLPGFGMEGMITIEGSYVSDDIQDYYFYPWELGYGSIVKLDHDFIGRTALEQAAAQGPKRLKRWLEWDTDDVMEVVRVGFFGDGPRPKLLSLPNLNPATIYLDSVMQGDRLVGLSTWGGYTVNVGRVVTIAILDESLTDGDRVEVLWGEPDGGAGRPLSEPHHVQTTIRATVQTRPPAQH